MVNCTDWVIIMEGWNIPYGQADDENVQPSLIMLQWLMFCLMQSVIGIPKTKSNNVL